MSSYDVIVIGVGSMGSAACYHLARRGVRVLGIERFGIPNVRGSHHGHSRMIRLAYYEHPDYVPLLRRSYELWHSLETEFGEKLLHLTGGLYMGPRGAEIVEGSMKSAIEHGLDHELLDGGEIRERFPQFSVPDDYKALLEPQAGFLLSEKAVAAHTAGALSAGAEIHGHEEVTGWRMTGEGAEIKTNRSTYSAAHVVFAGGAWTGQLVRDLGINLVVTRQVLGWFWPRNPEAFQLGTFPCWFIDTEQGYGHYGFPMMPDVPGLKLALHKPGAATNPNDIDRQTTAEDEETIRAVLREHLPSADGALLSMHTCLYTNSPDSHFVVGGLPGHEDRVTIACGFSGHGFKASSAIGEALADLAIEGRARIPLEFLSPKRFL